MKKPLILEYTVTKEITIPLEKLTKEELKYLKLWETDEDNYTEEDWEFMENHNGMQILERFIPKEEKDCYIDEEVNICSYSLE